MFVFYVKCWHDGMQHGGVCIMYAVAGVTYVYARLVFFKYQGAPETLTLAPPDALPIHANRLCDRLCGTNRPKNGRAGKKKKQNITKKKKKKNTPLETQSPNPPNCGIWLLKKKYHLKSSYT